MSILMTITPTPCRRLTFLIARQARLEGDHIEIVRKRW
jgi:hypothetical protein